MGYSKIYLHLVWTTYNREKVLTRNFKRSLFTHIKSNANTKGIYIDHINGYLDHVHCLIILKSDQSISQVVQIIKGESSYWINKSGLLKSKFNWQKEYYVISVGLSQVNIIRNYIRNQEQHHKKDTLEKELSTFRRLYFSRNGD